MYLSRTILFVLMLASWTGSAYLYSVNLGLEAKVKRLLAKVEIATEETGHTLRDMATGSIDALIQRANGIDTSTPEWDGQYVVVRQGDTLLGLADRHNQKVKFIVRLNKLKAPYTLYPGQKLLMP